MNGYRQFLASSVVLFEIEFYQHTLIHVTLTNLQLWQNLTNRLISLLATAASQVYQPVGFWQLKVELNPCEYETPFYKSDFHQSQILSSRPRHVFPSEVLFVEELENFKNTVKCTW